MLINANQMIKKVAHVRNYLYHTCATLLYTLFDFLD